MELRKVKNASHFLNPVSRRQVCLRNLRNNCGFPGGGFDTKKFMDDLTKKDCDMRLYFIPMTTSIFRPEMILNKIFVKNVINLLKKKLDCC